MRVYITRESIGTRCRRGLYLYYQLYCQVFCQVYIQYPRPRLNPCQRVTIRPTCPGHYVPHLTGSFFVPLCWVKNSPTTSAQRSPLFRCGNTVFVQIRYSICASPALLCPILQGFCRILILLACLPACLPACLLPACGTFTGQPCGTKNVPCPGRVIVRAGQFPLPKISPYQGRF